ncbi:LysR substrate-binding domain-containing protein [Nitratireductor sp. GCM10026969]|uniref:LysR substrate-binding domain-containing protein n=1 Tax=Nitratireductor sp. GCM10026969 TaxID=3252645 RepID=UPI003607226B
MRAARLGLGIALWVEHRVRDWIACGELVSLLEDWSAPYPGFHAYYYRDRHMSPATRAVLSFLRNASRSSIRSASEPYRS